MSNGHLWLIPGLPLAAAVLVGLFGNLLKGASHWPVVLAVVASCGLSLHALATVHGIHDGPTQLATNSVNWFTTAKPGTDPPPPGSVTVAARIVIDPIAAVMLTAITFIGAWISIFSIGYMHGDPGYPRFFAVFSGFVFSMCGLVMTDNLILLYGFWEGVGLCSYLLIGFWFAKPSAAAAARKAFLVTRLGDAGMILGIFMLWKQYGTLNLGELFAAAKLNPEGLTLPCLFVFCGAVGKSAQFPLHVWLPDAMEGPTPASALIHAATMVTAGVYLVGRCMPLFVLAPAALATVAFIGTFTALLAALIALTQHDLKRVMAYSTVSQLGFMFAALGSGQGQLASFAVTAAIFHLFTHAFFKALLFLASGSVMHAMGNILDMRRIGGLRHALPITHATFACGAAALAGIPLLSGFWSKDEILAVAYEAGHAGLHHAVDGAPLGVDLIVVFQPGHSGLYHGIYLFTFYGLLLTALLTAFYTGRAYFRTFWGEVKIPDEAGSHGHGHDDHHHGGVAHESPLVMTVPLMVLAVGAVLVGAILGPTHLIGHFFEHTPSFSYLPAYEHHTNWLLMVISGIVAITGVAAAYWLYVLNPKKADELAGVSPGLYALSQNRFYFDEIYAAALVGPMTVLALISKVFDMLVDGIVDLVGGVPSFFGWLLRPIQNGLVQFYALAMMMGLTVFLGILIFRR